MKQAIKTLPSEYKNYATDSQEQRTKKILLCSFTFLLCTVRQKAISPTKEPHQFLWKTQSHWLSRQNIDIQPLAETWWTLGTSEEIYVRTTQSNCLWNTDMNAFIKWQLQKAVNAELRTCPEVLCWTQSCYTCTESCLISYTSSLPELLTPSIDEKTMGQSCYNCSYKYIIIFISISYL